MAFYPYYPQPLNPYPQTPVQPYQDRLTQLQNNYQQTMPYGQAQIQQPMQQMPQVAMLPGQMVDGIDTVKAKDVDMTGNPVYYPKTDGTEIYKKQLQADGKSRIFVYRIMNPDEQQQPKAEEKPIDIEAFLSWISIEVSLLWIFRIFLDTISGSRDIAIFTAFCIKYFNNLSKKIQEPMTV